MLNNLYSYLERSWILSATIGDLSSRLTGQPVLGFYRFYFFYWERRRENIHILSNISFANKVKWLVSCKIWKANFDLYSDWWTVSEISPYGQMQHKNKIPKMMRTHLPRILNFYNYWLGENQIIDSTVHYVHTIFPYWFPQWNKL